MASQPVKKFTINAAFFQEIKEDHQQLSDLLDRLRKLVRLPQSLPDHRQEFARLLADLCDQLALHFSLEEAYGYFEDAIDIAPHLHSKSGELKAQHVELFENSRRLADILATEVCSEEKLEQVAGDFQKFDAALKAHERAEMDLILSAFDDDVGVSD